eukprot:CAMPEP_0181200202 /NCGR_PEP_ID=MMETSP1096-20121128/17623_1 /TAXON_ID=156174 ORGANISM="Chrysochromulina ericina, Strain CCMP281" /NCGR_SAMPLE_ID=MMETSP1096 /ASSEMBLY_ACC=CAM_ASM_000453 /LENGTH=111 /DNA_ID=CAMNT_0023290513 /DNA_START=400 /DNA_END=734 /DNA_ORIENTATION=-
MPKLEKVPPPNVSLLSSDLKEECEHRLQAEAAEILDISEGRGMALSAAVVTRDSAADVASLVVPGIPVRRAAYVRSPRPPSRTRRPFAAGGLTPRRGRRGARADQIALDRA